MKHAILSAMIGAAFVCSSASAIDFPEGQAIFDGKKCNLCHKVDTAGVGPSVHDIAKFYRGNETGLISYLKGEAEPAIDPKRAAAMQPQLVKIRALGDEKIAFIARYILLSIEREDM